MTKGKDAYEEIRHLLPLRVSDDLTADEAAQVDQEARYSEKCRSELESFAGTLQILRDASAEKLPTDDRPSLWLRLEPKLGPAGKQRRRRLPFVQTWQLAAACVALIALTVVVEYQPSRPAIQYNSAGNTVVDFRGPADPARAISQAAIRPLLGAVVQEMNPELRRRLGVPGQVGVVVIDVSRGSSADAAHLKRGDVILSVDGVAIEAPADMVRVLRHRKSGDEVQVEILRGGVQVLESIRLGTPQARNLIDPNRKSKANNYHQEAFNNTERHDLAEFSDIGNWSRV
ncbi:MAG: PDZ domain-containing protein [Planctomycetota bacterium]